jgi:hypothetical protein
MPVQNHPHHKANRLIHESSPYLLQHAYNPVDWHSWSPEALEKARQEDKPIILSIGYSACHWCHVMERESFEVDEVAALMNENYVCIKVDREERPDVDQIYMEAVQTMGIQGGWPLNVFLTPDQKPFFGGTYFPRTHWMQVLQNVTTTFKEKRQELEYTADGFVDYLTQSEIQKYNLAPTPLSSFGKLAPLLKEIYQKFAGSFDPEKGGMNRAPKFPMPANWLFLLRYYAVTQHEQALAQLRLTLNEMAYGGIYDQIGGGFARYSVDARWFAPHFEKMLYDNGQLLSLYAEAYSLTKEETYKNIVDETIRFAQRELMSPEGGFYAALDADSEGEEGKYYVWTQKDLEDILGKEAGLISDYYNVTGTGNWEHGNNILHKSRNDAQFAEKHQISEEELHTLVNTAKQKLMAVRNQRVRPGLDDKIIAGWNGLMLKGLVDAYAATAQPEYLSLALKNAQFIDQYLRRQDEESYALWHTYKEGKSGLPAYLDDYAFVSEAFAALYQVTFDEQWLYKAGQIIQHTLQHFYDEAEGFFYYTDDHSALIARKKEIFDNVIPSSNAAMAKNLHTVGLLLDNVQYTDLAESMMAKMLKLVQTEPGYLSHWAHVFTYFVKPAAEVAIVGPALQEYSLQLFSHYYPHKVVCGTTTQSQLPLLQNREAIQGETTLYVCYNKACKLPVRSVEEAIGQLEER